MDTLEELASKFDETVAKLRVFEKDARLLEDTVSEQSNQLLENDASSTVYQESVVMLEQERWTLSAEGKHLSTLKIVDKYLVDVVRTALALHETASQQHDSTYSKERERLFSEEGIVKTYFGKFWAEKKESTDHIQKS